jgi:lipoyl(octanoyl) transferase
LRQTHWAFLGRRPYGPTFELQQELRRKIHKENGGEHLLLLEHDPVYTVGRNAKQSDVLANAEWLKERGIEVAETNRGGQVTYHGPGQLVGYPILDLKPDRRDIGRYVSDLQEVLIRTLASFGIEARRKDGKDFIGVWVGERKIASIGVHLAHWITIHGFALNVATRLDDFQGIVACGLKDVTMTSIEKERGEELQPAAVAQVLVVHFAKVFGREMVPATPIVYELTPKGNPEREMVSATPIDDESTPKGHPGEVRGPVPSPAPGLRSG